MNLKCYLAIKGTERCKDIDKFIERYIIGFGGKRRSQTRRRRSGMKKAEKRETFMDDQRKVDTKKEVSKGKAPVLKVDKKLAKK